MNIEQLVADLDETAENLFGANELAWKVEIETVKNTADLLRRLYAGVMPEPNTEYISGHREPITFYDEDQMHEAIAAMQALMDVNTKVMQELHDQDRTEWEQISAERDRARAQLKATQESKNENTPSN